MSCRSSARAPREAWSWCFDAHHRLHHRSRSRSLHPVRELELGQAQEAVVLQPQVDVLSAPLDDETLTIFTVHEGTKVRIDRLSEEWAEVALEDGRVAWVPVGVLETI